MLLLLLFPCSPVYIPPHPSWLSPRSSAGPHSCCLLSPYIFLVLPVTAQPLSTHRSHSTCWHGVGKSRWGYSLMVLLSFGETKGKPQSPGCWQSWATQDLSSKAAILIKCSIGWWFFYYYYCSLPPHGGPSTEMRCHAPLGSTSYPGRRCRDSK